MQEFHCKVYQGYKISIPSKVRQILGLSKNDEIVLTVNDDNQVILNTTARELNAIQEDVRKFFGGKKSIVDDFLTIYHKSS